MKVTSVRRSSLAAALLAALAVPVRAQSPDAPLLTITIHAGWITGGSLWHLPAQIASAGPDSSDIVALGRLFRPGFVAGVSASLFRSPHLGYTAAIDFLGISTESRCTGPAHWVFYGDNINQQACESIQGGSVRTSAVALEGGLTWRPIATGRVQPYLQALGGIAYLAGSFVETAATVYNPSADTSQSMFVTRMFLGDPNHRSLTWVTTLSGGFTLEMSPGTQLRFAARDVITDVPVATGPGNPLVLDVPAQMGSKVVHLFSFTVGLDIVLEQSRRPHRY
ncbi:MAG: hypothetical protein ABSB58_11980 [Gemmatimonadales bacterium]